MIIWMVDGFKLKATWYYKRNPRSTVTDLFDFDGWTR